MAQNINPDIQEIVENLFAAIPIIHRKLIAGLDEDLGTDISHHHFAVLGMLSRHGALPVSEIGKKLWISKPQMTAVIDTMVAHHWVERQPDENDRRVIRIALTAVGEAALKKGQKVLQAGLVRKLAALSAEDLSELARSLRKINQIGSKIE